MMWIGSEWDHEPRPYKAGKTVESKWSLISEDWAMVNQHIITLLRSRVAIDEALVSQAEKELRRRQANLKTTVAKLSIAERCIKPE